MFKKYEKILDSSFSDDYWSDEGITYAAAKIDEFSDSDWTLLTNKVFNKPINWVIRCAETLGDINDCKSLKILISLLSIEDEEVQIAALDSVNSLISIGIEANEYYQNLLIKINNIESSSKIVKAMLNSLKSKLT